MREATKGLLLAIAASAAIATANISVQHFLQFTNPESMAIIWYVPTVAFAIAFSIFRKTLLKEIKNYWKQGLLLGAIYSVSALFWFNAVNLVGAELSGFLTRFEVVFTVLLAVIFLKEKLNYKEIAGIAIAVAGTLIISFRGGNYASLGAATALLASLALGFHILAAKKLIKNMHPVAMTGFRNFFAIIFLLAYVMAFKEFKPLEAGMLPLMIPLSLVSSLLGFYLLYSALRHLEAAKAGALRVLDPAFIVLYSFIIFSRFPSAKDLLGGGLILAGVLMLALSRKEARL